MNKINFKQPKYIFPLIVLPVIILIAFAASQYMGKEKTMSVGKQDLSLSLGDTQDSILSKNDAYERLFEKGDGRSMLEGLDKENDSLENYSDNLDIDQKRYIDSLKLIRGLNSSRAGIDDRKLYYDGRDHRNSDEKDFQRSAEMIRMLNGKSLGEEEILKNAKKTPTVRSLEKEQNDPTKILRKQMLMMDSLEKARDPQYQAALEAENKLKNSQEKMTTFLNSTLRVNKSSLNPSFNSLTSKKEDQFVKAVIDENLKGYLGSRIRFRLLEDIVVGRHKISKGSFLYGQISGFSLQRVNLNVVSILNNGEILPINLSVYDMDGMQGLYVPQSDFREMLREMGSNSVQGTNMDSGGEGFMSSMASKLFSSTSKTISNLIRQNKAKLKYNSYLFLINDKELKQNDNK
ncbi:conjugative transposon protein TraM [Chryseobacterium indoltheticum]|nr:conjugative transposon protein TraM [Chryseobacterium indoltheticum]